MQPAVFSPYHCFDSSSTPRRVQSRDAPTVATVIVLPRPPRTLEFVLSVQLSQLSQLRQLHQKIRIRERLPMWGLRLLLGAILMLLSELIMWQNPPQHSLIEWPVLLILYVCIAAILMDLIVRFQVNEPATLIIASAVYGLISSGIINHSAYANLADGPYGLLVRGLGLGSASGLYGLLLFIVVLRGKPAESLQVFSAMAVGILWGIWVHWFPIQPRIGWGPTPIETASLYILVGLILVGVLVAFVVPRFRFVREQHMELLWWEGIVVAVPLFIALLVGMIQNLIPALPLLIFIGIGAFLVWALSYQQHGTDPSILAEITFPAPNAITYIILAVAFFVAGTLAYNLITGPDSIAGVIVYWVAFAYGTFALPVAVLIIFWRVFRAQTAPADDTLDEADTLDE